MFGSSSPPLQASSLGLFCCWTNPLGLLDQLTLVFPFYFKFSLQLGPVAPAGLELSMQVYQLVVRDVWGEALPAFFIRYSQAILAGMHVTVAFGFDLTGISILLFLLLKKKKTFLFTDPSSSAFLLQVCIVLLHFCSRLAINVSPRMFMFSCTP